MMTWGPRFEHDETRDLADQIIHHRFPNTRDMDDPLSLSWAALPGIGRAVKRVREAARHKERVLVVGDADADGTIATAMMVLILRNLGIETSFFVPNRLTDGYGFGIEGVSEAKRVGATLIITVDCGTTNVETVQMAKDSGICTIVFDHHNLGAKRPVVHALVNPKVTKAETCFQDYVSASLVMLFFYALGANKIGDIKAIPGDAVNEEMAKLFWALSSIATVTDVATVLEENRAILLRGFTELAVTKNPALKILKDVLKIPRPNYHDIGWSIGPLFNAPGRMGHPDTVVKFLTAVKKDGVGITTGITDMETYNRRRKERQRRALPEARQAAMAIIGRSDPSVLVVCGDWHLGILGIVAGRLADELKRPAIVLAKKGEEWRGSGRSHGGLDLHKVLEDTNLCKFGGHSAAVGCTVRVDALEGFVGFLGGAPVAPEPPIYYDAEVPFSEIHSGLLSRLTPLAPHGPGNPWPSFVTRGVKVIQASSTHYNCNGLLIQGDRPFRFESRHSLKPKDVCDILYIPRFIDAHSRRSILLEVLDFQPS